MKIRFLLVSIFFVTMNGIVHANPTPNMSRVYGDQFIAGISQTRSAATIGTLDTNFASGGYQELNAQLTPSQAVAIQALSDGTFLAILQGSSCIVAKYNTEGVLQTSYNASSGFITLGLTTVQASMFDAQGRLVVSGNTTGAPYIQRVVANGSSVSSFTGGTWNSVAGLAQQTTGQIIAVGFDGTNGQIVRYNEGTASAAGAVDSTLNSSTGKIVFNGANGITATTGLYNVVVDASNNIYVAYIDSALSNNLYVAKFDVNGAFVSKTVLSYFGTTATASQVRMAIDMNGNLIVAAQVGNNILVSGITTSGGSIGGFTNTTVTGTNTLDLNALLTTSNGQIFLIGDDNKITATVSYKQRISCLNSTGGLNTSFNPSSGYNEFSATTPTTAGSLYAAAIANDGQIYVAGYESSGTNEPYVYRINNYQYISQVAQSPATTLEQGILDQSFGATSYETYPGVATVINGLYGSVLQQRAVTTLEVRYPLGSPLIGDILVGSNGLTDNKYIYDAAENGYVNTMFTYLTPSGQLDTAAGLNGNGFVTLQNITNSNEYMTSMVQDGYGNVYLSGYTSSSTTPTLPGDSANAAATMRVYSIVTAGNVEISVTDTSHAHQQGVGISLQSNRVLLCVAQSPTVGHITGYAGGILDVTFGDGGSGYIQSTSYGLNMGPCYGVIVDNIVDGVQHIFAAYVDSVTGHVDLVKFAQNGSALDGAFGGGAAVTNIFSGYTVDPSNVRIGWISTGEIVVAATGTSGGSQYILVTTFNPSTGGSVTTVTPTVIIGSTALHLTRVTGVSDGSIILTLWDTAADDTMYLARIVSGALDTTFNSQGSQPGVLPIKVGDKTNSSGVVEYTDRMATCALVQSTPDTGNQGNIIMIGHESLTTSDSTPMVMRVYGEPGSTEVLSYQPDSTPYPGTLDTSFDLATSPLVSPTGLGNAIFAYPAGVGHDGKILVAIDGTFTITIDGAIYTVHSSMVARLTPTGLNMTLDTTFGGGTGIVYIYPYVYSVLEPLTGINSINIDSANDILISGNNGSVWAQIIPDNGVSFSGRASFDDNGASRIVFDFSTTANNLSAINKIYQQKSGRYIIAGTETTTGKGLLVAFQDHLVSANPVWYQFQVDPTFNPLSVGSTPYAGCYYVGSTDGLSAMAINTNDTIAVAYSVSGTATVTSITADGSGPNLTFNSGTAITTGVSADSSAAVQIGIDGSRNVIVGASYNSGITHQVQVQRFDFAGGTSTAFTNGGIVSGNVATISNLGTSGFVLTGLMPTTSDGLTTPIGSTTVLTGYNSDTSGSPFFAPTRNLFAARLVSNGALDATWNPESVVTYPDTPGVLTYEVFSAVNMKGAAILSDGSTVLSIGSTAGDYSSANPIVSLVYGDGITSANPSGVTEIAQNPLQAAAGTLDSTIAGSNTSGELPLGSLPVGPSVTGVPQKIYIYNQDTTTPTPPTPNVTDAYGAMLLASTDNTHVYITKMNADLSLAGTNGSPTFGTSGVVTITPPAGSITAITITDLYVANGTNDSTQPIYVTGYTNGSTKPFIYRIADDGSSSTVVTSPAISALTTTGCIRQSTNGRVLVSGFNGTHGAIVAYNSAMTAIDTSFGNGSGVTLGYYATTTANPIVAMTTDNSDRVYIAYLNTAGTAVLVQRLLENGTGLDTSFGSSGTYTISGTNLSATQIKMSFDFTNSQLVIAVQSGQTSGNSIQVQRLSVPVYASGGSNSGSLTHVVAAGAVFNLADLFIDNNQDIYVAGYLASGTGVGNSVVIRLNSSVALDTSYATTGIANNPEGAMTVVTAAALDPDRRVYMVGSNGSTAGYMGRFYGDYYWTQDSQAILQATVGTVDLTLNSNGYSNQNGINLITTPTNWSALAGYQPFSIIENPNGDGSSYIAFGNGTNLIVGQLNADMIPVTTFGGNSTGLITPLAMTTITNIMVDAQGNIIVAGANGSSVGDEQVLSFTSAGVLNATFSTAFPLGNSVGIKVLQQKSGRYIVVGLGGGQIVFSGYKNESAISSGTLPFDPTFGKSGFNGYFTPGIYSSPDDMVIDAQDYIYFVFRDGSNLINIGKVTANGSGLVTAQNSPTGFAGGGSFATGITATQPAHIAINAAGNILVGATTASGPVVRLYDPNGTPLHAAVTAISGSNYVLTQLVGSVASTNEFYGSVYNSSGSQAITFAITSTGAIDTVFNASSSINPYGTAGYIATTTLSPVGISGLSVQRDGKIVMVGYTTMSTVNEPILLRAYGYPYVSQYAQAPDQVVAGLLDTTLWPTSGALELDTYYPIENGITPLAGSRVKRIYEYSNGQALLLLDNTGSSNNATTLLRINKDLTLDTSFNSGGTSPSGPGYVTIAGKTGATSLFVNTDGDIYIAGGATTSWIYAFNSDGTAKTGWTTPTSNLSAGAFQVAVQSNQRVVIAGQNTNGAMIGYTPTGALDSSFGVAGVVNNGSAHPITDIAIDEYNDIFTVINNGGSVVLQKYLSSGAGTPVTSAGTQITTVSGRAIKVVLDASGRIIVAAPTATGFELRSYNNNATLTLNATVATITAGTSSPAWVIANIYVTSDGKITLIGYDSATGSSTAGQILVARVLSASGGLTLDTTTFNPTAGYLVTAIGSLNVAYDGFICADDRIMIGGTNSTSAEPFLGRVFGDTYVSYVTQAPAEGVTGTLNTTFGNTNPPTGEYAYSSGVFTNAQGQAILPLGNGSYYAAFGHANSGINSVLIKTVADGSLDTSYNSTGIATSYAPLGVASMLQDSANNIVLIGTAATGWLKRYTSAGVADSTFGSSGLVTMPATSTATAAVEQTIGRLVVAGSLGSYGALFAYTEVDLLTGTAGVIDTTFNAGIGGTPGSVQINTTDKIYNLIADSYDRLIFAVFNSGNSAVDLYRLTPTGALDITFGSGGILANALTNITGETNVRVAFDIDGNILVAATSATANTFSVNAFDDGNAITVSSNGNQIGGWNGGLQLDTSLLNNPLVTGLVVAQDGAIFVLGNQTGTQASWIAKLTDAGALDTTFNPAAIDGVGNPGTGFQGIFQYSLGGGTTAHVYNGLAVNNNGTLGMIGYENSSGAFTPTIVGVYDDPFTSQKQQFPGTQAIGTNDISLGWTGTDGIVYYGVASGLASYNQVARALGLYTDNNIVVAMDGKDATSSNSSIFLNMFDNDGLLYSNSPAFGTAGQVTVLQGSSSPTSPNYQNQYVNDMITFNSGGVVKAIIAGYVKNTNLPSANQNSSLLLQYILTPGSQGIDTANFGGFDENPAGIAFGDGQKIFTVGQQSNGRIIAAGLSKSNLGLLLAYTAAGKLDASFGNNGYQSVNTGSTGIYSHAIDSQNRVVFAYNNGGTVDVARFLPDGSALTTPAFTTLISTVTSDDNIKVAVDSSDNVYVAAVTGGGNTITINKYPAAGGASTIQAPILYSSIGGTSGANYMLARMIVDQQGNVIVVAYDTTAAERATLVMRLTSSLVLDTTNFNASNGYITYAVGGGSTSQVATDALIHPDGRIIIVGSES